MPKLTKRADGRYQIQVYIGRDANGKKKYRTVYGSSMAETRRKAEEIRQMLGKGIDLNAVGDTFSDWRENWLRKKKAKVGAKHYETLKDETAYMVERLGKLPISKIRTSQIQDALDELADMGRAYSTLQKVRQYTKAIFAYAVDNRVMDYNPVGAVELPSAPPPEERKPIGKEQQRWIREMPHRAQTAAMIMLYAGLRRGEVIPLTWADIDLDAQTIRVCKSVEIVSSKARLKDGAKTEAGNRTVDIPHVLVDYLRPLRPQNDGGKVVQLDRLVCPAARGGMMSSTSWRSMWNSYMTDLNLRYGYHGERSKYDPKKNGEDDPILMLIEPFTAHQLRHTYATMLYLAGVDVMTAKEQLGHSDIRITLGIYTHLDKLYKRRSMAKLDDYLDGEKKETSEAYKSDTSQGVS